MKDRNNFIICRAISHDWDIMSGSGKRRTWGYPLYLRCARCGTERKDNFDIHGTLIQRTYQYPDGYQEAAIDLSRDQVRVKALRRIAS